MNLPVLLLLLGLLVAHGHSLAAPPKPAAVDSKATPSLEQQRRQAELLRTFAASPDLTKKLDELQAVLADRNVPSEATHPAEHHAHQAHVNKLFGDAYRVMASNGARVANLAGCLGLSQDRLRGWINSDVRVYGVLSQLCKRHRDAALSAALRSEVQTVIAKGSTQLPGKRTPLSKAYVHLLLETLEDDGCVDQRLLSGVAKQLERGADLAVAFERASTELFGPGGCEFALARLKSCTAAHGWDDDVAFNLR